MFAQPLVSAQIKGQVNGIFGDTWGQSVHAQCIWLLGCKISLCHVDMVIMGLKRFSNQELTDVIKAAGTLQFDDDMLLDRTSQQLMLSIHKMSAEELFNLVGLLTMQLHTRMCWCLMSTCQAT